MALIRPLGRSLMLGFAGLPSAITICFVLTRGHNIDRLAHDLHRCRHDSRDDFGHASRQNEACNQQQNDAHYHQPFWPTATITHTQRRNRTSDIPIKIFIF